MSAPVLTEVDVCAGIGGVSLAAELAGFTPTCFVEIDPFCQRVLAKHWPEVPILGDIRTLTVESFRTVGVERIDFMHISPPCQFASIAGKQQGTADPRYLWPDAFRLVAGLRPRVVLVENVDFVVRMVLDDWLTDLESIGYQARAIVLPACAVGAPHLRYRLFVVAHATGTTCDQRPEPAVLRGRTHPTQQIGVGGGVMAHAGGVQPERGRGHGCSPSLVDADGSGQRTAEPDVHARESNAPGCGTLGNPNGAGCPELDTAAIAGREGLPTWERDARTLADAESERGQIWPAAQERPGRPAGSGDPLGNAEERPEWAGLCPSRSERLGRGRSDDTDSQDGGTERSQPGVGRSADGFSDWMEQRGLIWPALHGAWSALMGLPQHDWEPPRTVPKQGRNGRKRLKALGNAVVPAQVAPILFVIADWLRDHAVTDEEAAV